MTYDAATHAYEWKFVLSVVVPRPDPCSNAHPHQQSNALTFILHHRSKSITQIAYNIVPLQNAIKWLSVLLPTRSSANRRVVLPAVGNTTYPRLRLPSTRRHSTVPNLPRTTNASYKPSRTFVPVPSYARQHRRHVPRPCKPASMVDSKLSNLH